MTDQPFLNLEEAALLLKKSTQSLRRLIKKGKLPAQQVKTPQGFRYILRREDLAALKEKVGKKLFYNLPIQNAEFPLQDKEKRVLINQNQIPTNQTHFKPHQENKFLTIDISKLKMASQSRPSPAEYMKIFETQAKEKMMLIHILARLQAELALERRKHRSFLERLGDWLSSLW